MSFFFEFRHTIRMKMTLLYIFLLLLPTLLFSVFSVYQVQQYSNEKYLTDNQFALEEKYSTLQAKLRQYESFYNLFQNNSMLIEFLDTDYSHAGSAVYDYLKNVRPLFNYVLLGSDMENISIYQYQMSIVTMYHDILPIEQLSNEIRRRIPALSFNGQWVYHRESGHFSFYKEVFTDDFSRALGLMEITVDENKLLSSFLTPEIDSKQLEIHITEPECTALENDSDYLSNRLHISELDACVTERMPKTALPSFSSINIFHVYFSGMIVLLSVVYFFSISLIIRRLNRLAVHMESSGDTHLTPFSEKPSKDEIGILVTSYNQQIQRINMLISEVYEAQLKKQKAEYQVLRAQVKPHFIYNSIETLRMQAVINNDPSVADMAYSLGRFIRYNLSRKVESSRLKDEMENIRHYLQIYKASMGKRLEYTLLLDENLEDFPCPGFILQPFVENAIHHGMTAIRSPLRITVEISLENGMVLIRTIDNGAGIPPERLKELRKHLAAGTPLKSEEGSGNGIGIYNVCERLKMFYRTHFTGLTIQSQENSGTCCVLRVKEEKIENFGS